MNRPISFIVTFAALTALPGLGHASVKLCFSHGVNFVDSGMERSPSCADQGLCEDHWEEDDFYRVRGMLVHLRKETDSRYFYLDGSGCTDYWSPTSGDRGRYKATLFSMGIVDGNYVLAVDAANNVATTTVYSNFSGSMTRDIHVSTAGDAQVQAQFNVYSAAAFALSRHDAGDPQSWRFRVGTPTNCSSSNGSCFRRSADEINITTDSSARKFVIAHEMGHKVMWHQFDSGETWQNDTSMNSAVCPGSGHKMWSLEWDSGALQEGWAHFYAAAVWNNRGSDCAFGYWREKADDSMSTTAYLVNCEVGTPDLPTHYRDNVCMNGTRAGRGVELDWLRAWWDFYQDPGSRPGFDDILGALRTASPWGASDAYDTFTGALSGSVRTRWLTAASRNGID